MGNKFGVDVSEFQTDVDYETAVKDGGVEFAILRAGYGWSESGKDACFDEHYNGFSRYVPVGAYHFSYARDVASAKKEAASFLKWIAGKRFSLPLFYDMEESAVRALGKKRVTAIADAWCAVVKKAGYRAGVYASTYWFETVLDKSHFDYVWVADWGKTTPSPCDIWQFGGGSVNFIRGKYVDGIGVADQNYLINANLIDGTVPEKPKEDKETVDITLDVLREGYTGPQAATLQRLLIGLGYPCGDAGDDGIFGPMTRAAVLLFQQDNGLFQDAIVGAKTWNKLLK